METAKITKIASRIAEVEKKLGELDHMRKANAEGSRTCHVSDIYSKVELDSERTKSVYAALIKSYEDEKSELLTELKDICNTKELSTKTEVSVAESTTSTIEESQNA